MRYFILFCLILNLVANDKVLNLYEIHYKFKNIKQEKYDILSLKHYLKTLYLENKSNLEYKEKSDYLTNDITQDKYNFNIYIDGYLRSGKRISNDITTNIVYSEKGVAFHIDKLLFDRDYFLSKKYIVLYKRLANIEKINRKNTLLMAGVLTYINLYFSENNLKIFKNLLKTQEVVFEKIKKRLKKGVISKLDFISAKNDLLKLKKSIILAKEEYLKNDYILRQSINSNSKKPFIIQPFEVNFNIPSVYEVQKQILKNNAEIAINSNLLKIKKLELLSAKRRFFPEISYYSYIGYSESIDKKFSLDSNLNTKTWEVGLTLLIPLYNKNDITLKTQKAKYDVLLQQNELVKKMKDNLIKTTNLFYSIKSLSSQIEITKSQLELSKEKLDILKKQLLVGVVDYDKYSKALKDYLTNLKTFQTLKQKRIIDIYLLNILLGK